jgi:hypothetical protein
LFEAARGDAARAKLDAEALLSIGRRRELPLWITYGSFLHG